MRILVFDSDHQDYSETGTHLKAIGHDIEFVSDKKTCLATAVRGGCDLVLLNPLDSGKRFSLLRQLRDITPLPVIVVANTADSIDVVLALELGADDYISKPLEPRQLAARIVAVLRRANSSAAGYGLVRVGPLTLNPRRREAWIERQQLSLTTIEFLILERLMRAAGCPVSREDLIRQIYKRDATGFDKSLAVHISHLRKKLSTDAIAIKTIWGTGYQLCPSGSEDV